MTQSTYTKDNSFVDLSGIDANAADVVKRVRALAGRLDGLGLEANRHAIVKKACEHLLSGEANKDEGGGFWLRPHTVEEIRRVSDDDLPRYLYYRYRYDVFPASKEIDAFPPCVQIEPTSVCNYRCVFCYQTDPKLQDRKAGHKGRMSLDTFKQVVDQIEGEVEAVTLASRGEPLLAKGIEDMLAYAAGKFLGLKINTNAWYLNEKKAHALLSAEPNTIVFSADAADEKLYEDLRVNGKLETVLENVRLFADIKEKHYPNSKTITRVSGVKFSDRQDFAAIEGFWKEYVDQVAFVDYNPWVSVYDAEPTNISTPCSDLWRRMFVWWDGRANPCDVDYLSSLSTGNIKDASLSEIWQGAAYERLRHDHLEGRRERLSPCNNCAVL